MIERFYLVPKLKAFSGEQLPESTTPIVGITGERKLTDFRLCADKKASSSAEHVPWSEQDIQLRFAVILGKIAENVSHPSLTMHGRTFSFVDREKLRPQTEEERQQIIDTYGEYAIDGSGDCRQNPDGTYLMRIGYHGLEDSSSEGEVLEVMAHEYGHTLGGFLKSPVLEELKAYAFDNLFMRIYYDNDQYLQPQIYTSTVHDDALLILGKFLNAGVSEELLIANLTQSPFGIYQPEVSSLMPEL